MFTHRNHHLTDTHTGENNLVAMQTLYDQLSETLRCAQQNIVNRDALLLEYSTKRQAEHTRAGEIEKQCKRLAVCSSMLRAVSAVARRGVEALQSALGGESRLERYEARVKALGLESGAWDREVKRGESTALRSKLLHLESFLADVREKGMRSSFLHDLVDVKGSMEKESVVMESTNEEFEKSDIMGILTRYDELNTSLREFENQHPILRKIPSLYETLSDLKRQAGDVELGMNDVKLILDEQAKGEALQESLEHRQNELHHLALQGLEINCSYGRNEIDEEQTHEWKALWVANQDRLQEMVLCYESILRSESQVLQELKVEKEKVEEISKTLKNCETPKLKDEQEKLERDVDEMEKKIELLRSHNEELHNETSLKESCVDQVSQFLQNFEEVQHALKQCDNDVTLKLASFPSFLTQPEGTTDLLTLKERLVSILKEFLLKTSSFSDCCADSAYADIIDSTFAAFSKEQYGSLLSYVQCLKNLNFSSDTLPERSEAPTPMNACEVGINPLVITELSARFNAFQEQCENRIHFFESQIERSEERVAQYVTESQEEIMC